jgi:hypothetical protein
VVDGALLADGLADAGARSGVGRVADEQLGEQVLQLGVAVVDRHELRRAVLVEQVDRAPVARGRDGEGRDGVDGLVDVERRRRAGARHREER